MSEYKHPYQDTQFVLSELVGFDGLCQRLQLDDIDTDFAMAILSEAEKLAVDVIAPLNRKGDEQGALLENNTVKETEGFAAAYQQFVEGGWPALIANSEYGGQGLPEVLGSAVNEMWHSANMSFALCPLLTQGAIESIERHGCDELKQNYLPKLISGEWTGTMNLTEPDAGSDLAAVKTKATPAGDHYLIKGQKIFITWGDHQMTDNIIHLVLARLPDAPSGVKGISLFVVPKFLLDEQGNPAQKNDVQCTALEHKLGIHGSPTCVMSFGDNTGAVGYLVGEPHKGLMSMFTMMNNARQSVGLQGLSISERAYQQALNYAKERLQKTNKDGSREAIIGFPDVRRMLMQMKASIEAMRGLAYTATADIDCRNSAADDAEKTQYQHRIELMTPIIKGWMTELAQEVTYLGLQIHGGMGYIEETGAAQHYRDARILTIYEGTTGIQALDLVGRKILLNQGEHLTALLEDIQLTVAELEACDSLPIDIAPKLKVALADAKEATQWLLQHSANDHNAAASISVPLMMMLGYLAGAWLMARSALKAQALLNIQSGDQDFLQAKLHTVQFYFEHLLPRAGAYLSTIKVGSESIMALSEEQL